MRMVVSAVLVVVVIGGAADLYFDAPRDWFTPHVLIELTLMTVSAGVALLLLKGHAHKQIAAATQRSERTVRQHGVTVYEKSGLAGRAELAAFFLESLMLPSPRQE